VVGFPFFIVTWYWRLVKIYLMEEKLAVAKADKPDKRLKSAE
jgi:hypothetical protein